MLISEDLEEIGDSGSLEVPADPFSVQSAGFEAPDPLALRTALDGPSLLEPVRQGEIAFDLAFTSGALARVAIVAGDQEIVVLEEEMTRAGAVVWDGRDAEGALMPPGTYTLEAEVSFYDQVEMLTHPVRLVSVGVQRGDLEGEEIPLIWHRDGGAGMFYQPPLDMPLFSLSLEAEPYAASFTEVPTIWPDLSAPPPEGVIATWPGAYAWDARPILTITFAGDWGEADLEDADPEEEGVDIVPAIPGWSLVSGSARPGEQATFVRDAALAAGPQVVEETLTVQYLLDGETLLAEQDVPLRLYALMGAPTFTEDGLPYGPWLAAIDPALRAIGGVSPIETAVVDELVAFIYNDMGLRYDTARGASAYVQYQGAWSRAHFNFSAFLDRDNGEIINCTDAAAILGAYANMIGADIRYQIIDPRFDLNQIKAIGGADFSNCPFDSGRCGFRYHAVTTLGEEAELIYDATLALDGDDDPGAYPGTELLVRSIPAETYMERLVMAGTPYYHSLSKGTIQ